MKTFLIILGIIFLAIIFLAIALFGIMCYVLHKEFNND